MNQQVGQSGFVGTPGWSSPSNTLVGDGDSRRSISPEASVLSEQPLQWKDLPNELQGIVVNFLDPQGIGDFSLANQQSYDVVHAAAAQNPNLYLQNASVEEIVLRAGNLGRRTKSDVVQNFINFATPDKISNEFYRMQIL